MPPRKPDLLGCHVSVAGGLDLAPGRADELGAFAIQIFTANQRRWVVPELSDEQVEAFRAARKASKVRVVMSHDSYLVNLASPKQDVWDKSLEAFITEYRRCTRLGVDLLNFHPGAHLGEGEEAGIERVVEGLGRAIDAVPDSATRLVVELTAGQGSSLGGRIEHAAAILDRVEADPPLGVCIDTQHVYAAGYDIREEKGYRTFFRDFDQLVGRKRLCAFHINDSKTELASRVDRHEEIGKGTLGRAFFKRLMKDRRLARVPMMLETPDETRYADELRLLRRLRTAK
ncbi:MAG: deoxyribonuclease IV [Deltaproteobacteria bacterium]|jgi:deoxyribonuclease-4|nr:deoxyribonuclease IV [Deltaproteobacteria bacterium]MBW2532229.1 deoxyribonuclease IV [Deltaproteobacteria bacterium]